MKGYYILAIQSKDLYGAMNSIEYIAAVKRGESPIGYKIRRSVIGVDGTEQLELNYKKFTNTLDWSLDEIKLEEVYFKVMRNSRFATRYRGKSYTQQVINVNFDYSYKEFNRAGKNVMVRAGYTYSSADMVDGACVKDGKLVAIQLNVEIQNPLPQEVLGKYFTFTGNYYEQIGQIPTLMSKSELREYLYENGFVCDGIKYVRYKRSSGSSRVGKCLFVNEALADRMAKYDKCGLSIKDGDKIDLAAYEAYIALPTSSIIDTLDIKPENFLVIDDWESKFEDEVVAVEVGDGKLVAGQKIMPISNSIWDGESLMDISLFGKYQNKGMLLLRNRFFKTCAFNTNIQQYFKDEGITSVEQLNGFTLAENIEDIKIITTPSSIKYAKFGKIEDWLKNIDKTFGIVKYEKETHYFNGRMVQAHYQLFNTIQLSYEDAQKILQPSLDYVKLLRSDPDVLRNHIKYPYDDFEDLEYIDDDNNDDNDDDNDEGDGEDGVNEELGEVVELISGRKARIIKPDKPIRRSVPSSLKSKNEIVFKMLGINNNFAKTRLYKEFRDDLVKGFIRNLKRGHILLNGNYSTLLGNGLEMLMSSIGKFNGEGVLQPAQIHSKRFEYGKTIMGSRSPHPCVANILLTTNVANEEIDKYFNLTNEIVYINAINENIQQKLNG